MGEIRILSDLCERIVDCAHKTVPLDVLGHYFAVGTPAMRGNVIDYSEAKPISRSTFEEWTERLRPRYGDLLLAREAPVGPIVRIPESENVAPGQRTVLLRPRNDIVDSRYLYYYLTSPHQQVNLLAKASGSTVPHLNVSDVRTLPVSGIPPLEQQGAIAEILGALDDKIAANEVVARATRELGEQLFVRAAASGSGIPTTIGELSERSAIEFSDGYRTKKVEHGQPGLRILRAGDVRDSYVYPAGQDYVSLDYSRQIGSKASVPGDIVLTTKGTVGRVAVVAEGVERVVYSPQVCFFRAKDDGQVDRGYLGAWFRSSDLQRQASTLMYKSDMAPYISLRDIRSLVVPLPSIGEQRRIGEVQSNLLAAFDASRVENERLARTRDALLPLLMAGKVSVRGAVETAGSVV